MADLYAIILLYLAISGIFMIKGKLGLRWRGAVLISLGLGVPLSYVVISGGPSAHQNAKTASTTPKAQPVETAPTDEVARPPERMAPRPAPPADDEFARPPARRQPPADGTAPATDERLPPGATRKQPPADDATELMEPGGMRPRPQPSDASELMEPGSMRPRKQPADATELMEPGSMRPRKQPADATELMEPGSM